MGWYPDPMTPQPPGDPYQYDLRWIVSQVQSLTALCSDLARSQTAMGGNVEALNGCIQQLKDAQTCINERMNAGDFADEDFRAWADANLPTMVWSMVRFVWFGLTDDGRLACYVPANWGWLNFNTPANIDDPDYGHLIITY